MDNTTDFLLTDSDHATRPQLIKNEKFVLHHPVAEHGFSALITIPKSELNTNKSFLLIQG